MKRIGKVAKGRPFLKTKKKKRKEKMLHCALKVLC
jgi:hypothetical protein